MVFEGYCVVVLLRNAIAVVLNFDRVKALVFEAYI